MSNGCCTEKSSQPMASCCPSSGSTGVAVDRQTVKALLTEMALGRLGAGAYRFCPDPDCDVVYFDGHASSLELFPEQPNVARTNVHDR